MFKIFYDTLVRPKEIANHVDSKSKGKFIGFLILLIIILVIPYFIAQLNAYSFTNEEAKNIAYYMLKEEPIEYEIKNGELSYTGTDPIKVESVKVQKDDIKLVSLPVYLVFSLDGTGYEINDENAYIVIFKQTEIEVLYRPYKKVDGATQLAATSIYDEIYPTEETSLKTLSYKDINANLNYEEGYKEEFYLTVYSIGSVLYDQIKWNLILENALFTFILNIVSFFMNILFTAIIFNFMFKRFGLNFKVTLKIATLCSTVYVIGYVLAYLYNIQFISLVGEFLSMIYTYNVMKHYALLKMTYNNGGN